jgi:hypothetical protein
MSRNYCIFGLCPSSDIPQKLENTAFRKQIQEHSLSDEACAFREISHLRPLSIVSPVRHSAANKSHSLNY